MVGKGVREDSLWRAVRHVPESLEQEDISSLGQFLGAGAGAEPGLASEGCAQPGMDCQGGGCFPADLAIWQDLVT